MNANLISLDEIQQGKPNSCCSAEHQAVCCEPSAKAECCGSAADGACGCAAPSQAAVVPQPAAANRSCCG